ncbi:DUF4249 domain-containing protein [Niabella sp. CC-SYL272]|uniref:DUF4249 domain-containing protein n=1 Tax=Niabella agricola TaxID=2891571 RepID=UPI001F243AF4|nr:DUF4249 domain-containing protein [Niabella agricola]MCF3107589.1 DUF4249 domain-containing protein [Niabella agricola]
MTPDLRPFYMLLLLLFACCSCRKVIYPEYEAGTAPKTVIQASLTDQKDSAVVFISETLAVDAPNAYSGKDGAIVSITGNGSAPVILNSRGNGRYTAHIATSAGSAYTLKAQVEGVTYSAVSTMPAKVAFDSLFITQRSILGRTLRIPTVVFTDPPASGNYYRFILSVDGFESTTIFIENDRLFNGNKMTLELLDVFTDSNAPTFIDPYDRVIVEMQCISKDTFDYFSQLKAGALGEGNSSNPGNPLSNIAGGALGYFSVHTSEKKELFAD